MRPASLLVVASTVLLMAGSALAAGQSGSSASRTDTDRNPNAATPATPATPGDQGPATPATPATPSDRSANTGTSANTSATAGGFTVGETVKDNTGATIGTITDLKTDASGKQSAVIKMGSDQFSVATSNLGSASGAATINLTQAQIASMLHKSGPSAPATGH